MTPVDAASVLAVPVVPAAAVGLPDRAWAGRAGDLDRAAGILQDTRREVAAQITCPVDLSGWETDDGRVCAS
jgi:hypothetical protein